MRLTSATRPKALATIAATFTVGAAAVAIFALDSGLGPGEAHADELEPFDSCDELLAYAHDHRWALGTPYPGEPVPMMEDAVVRGVAGAESSAAAPDPVGPGTTGTNIQEAGIDEPDVAKLAGSILYVLARGELVALAVSGDDPVELGRVELGRPGKAVYGSEPQLLIAGDTALVITQHSSGPEWEPATRLLEVDISDPTAPVVAKATTIEGSFVSARLEGATARLVLSSQADFPAPGDAEEQRPEAGATGATGPVDPAPEDPGWLPQATVTDTLTGARDSAPLFGCEDVAYPERFSGLGLLSVLTVELGPGTQRLDTDAVLTNGDTVYASAGGLYVATEEVPRPEGDVASALSSVIGGDVAPPPPPIPDETLIHRFDTSDPAATSYTGSGEVDGRLLNQFSMSEHDGYLRVATTTGDPWAEGSGESQSGISVLATDDSGLEPVGDVGGLGRGEEIRSVRFIDDTAYVVTFEQTDPLYVVDLSDPADPVTTGELKIPGYSAYLHPVGDGRILGVGQAGSSSGVITGAQASLFDVADPRDPRRTAALKLTDGEWGQSGTEADHHAFLYWPGERLAVAPVTSYGPDGLRGAVAMHVGADGSLTELATLEDGGQIRRAIVAGDHLLTITGTAVTARPLASLERTGSVALGG